MWFRLILILVVVVTLPLPESVQLTVFVVVMLIGSFASWRGAVRRARMVRDTPTSKIATAAKGYTELHGRARSCLGVPLRDPITDAACVWFYVQTERYQLSKLRWKLVDCAMSRQPFALEDETGLCLIDVGASTFRVRDSMIVKQGIFLRHKLKRVLEGEFLYAIGHLDRLEHAPPPPEEETRDTAAMLEYEARVAEQMREWKRDPTKRDRIFDPNGDGMTDEQEMEFARKLARAVVDQAIEKAGRSSSRARRHAGAAGLSADKRGRAPPTGVYAVGGRPVTHWLRRPDEDRPFIVSTLGERALVRKERRLGLVWLFVFVFFLLFAISLVLAAIL